MITTVDELGSVLSNVTPTAAAMNVSFEQVSAALANMTSQGTPAAQATTQLNSLMAELGKSGTKAQKGLEEALQGTEYAGQSFQDLMAAGVPLNDVLDLLNESAEANGLTMLDMFGSIEAGKAALAVSGKNSEAFTKTLDKMNKSTGEVDKAYQKVSGTTKDKFNKMTNQLKNTMISLFAAVEPIISTALPILMTLISEIAPLLELLFSAISPIIEAALPIFQSLLEALMPILEVLIAVLQPIIDLFISLLDPILTVINVAIMPLIDAILLLINMALKPVVGVLEAVGKVFDKVFESAAMAVNTYVEMIKGVLKGLISFIKAVFTGDWKAAWSAVKDIFGSIFNGMKSLFTIPINWIIDGLNLFFKALNKVKIPSWVPKVGGKGFHIDPIKKIELAEGGVVSGETDATVGEYSNANVNPEVVAPLDKLKSLLGLDKLGMSDNISSSMQSIVINVTGNTIAEEMDINNIGDMFTKKLQNEGVL